MLGVAASIASGMIMSKYGGAGKQQVQLPQTSLKEPNAPDLYRKFGRGIARPRTKFLSRRSTPATVETGTYGPLSTYNSILKKQLGLLTSKA
jgi:hypothetical protein